MVVTPLRGGHRRLTPSSSQKGSLGHALPRFLKTWHGFGSSNDNIPPDLTAASAVAAAASAATTEVWEAYWTVLRFTCVVVGTSLLGDIAVFGTPVLRAINRLELAFRLAVFLAF